MIDLVRAAQNEQLRVYFAGKINERYGTSTWRQYFGVEADAVAQCHIAMCEDCEFIYCGPLIDNVTDDNHASQTNHATANDKHDRCWQTFSNCLRGIDSADIVVGLAEHGCYGTMWELGYSFALDKMQIVKFVDPECWFANINQADYGERLPFNETLEELQAELVDVLTKHKCFRQIVTSSQSPLEEIFGKAWMDLVKQEGFTKSDLLWPQVQAGRYRIDYANTDIKLAIELDGFTYHSSRQQFGNDRERERKLIEMGWKVIRFHGDEIRESPNKVVLETWRHMQIRKEEMVGV